MKNKLFLLGGFVLINIIFNYHIFWQELVFDRSTVGAVWGEVQVYEWLTEKFYRTLLAGENPFGLVSGMLYPFDIHVGLTDAGNGLFYLFLRPFLSTHQSMAMIATLSNLSASLGMYLLLRKLNLHQLVSVVLGLAYGYTTFIMPRGGHLNYWTTIYLFPWFYYFVLSLIKAHKTFSRVLFSLGAAVFFVLTLWLNFYYFIILLISILNLGLYLVIFRCKSFWQSVQKIGRYALLTVFFILILLIPWFKGMWEIITFDELPKTTGWAGAIEFSSDLFHYFFPNHANYLIYKYFSSQYDYLVSHYFKFATGVFENFTYPGVIIIISYFVYLFLFKKKGFQIINRKLKPYLITSLVFLILTLGPFLHVFGHWRLTVDEGIAIVVPLPYMILHYLPFLENIRVPGRLVIGFIFFAYIVCGYILTHILKNKSKQFVYLFFIVLLFIFVADHRYVDTISPPAQLYPYKIYELIRKDADKFSVMEIPFTVRDGFTYFGDGEAIDMIIGEAWHNKPVIGGYTGRIADYKKNYYRLNPFMGYFGRLIDGNLMNNPIIDKNALANWQELDLQKGKDVIEFLDLKYIITDNNRPYSASVSALLEKLDFAKNMDEKIFSLWRRPLQNKEFLTIDLGAEGNPTYLGMGWHTKEDGFRWVDKKSYVMFKLNKKRKMDLHFEGGAFYQNQPLTIFVNKKKIVKTILNKKKKSYNIALGDSLEKGLNRVYFFFDKSYKANEIMPNSNDQRKIAAELTKIYLTERQ